MKIFVTGVNGQLGHDVAVELVKRGHTTIGSDIAPAASLPDVFQMKRLAGSAIPDLSYVQLDITDTDSVMEVLTGINPDAVIHCAAWTAVDMAEDAENVAKVRKVNVDGTTNIAAACRAIGAKMLYLSTDYVFDGQGTEPWKPDDKNFAPVNVYGRSKLDGELAVASFLEKYFIVRIAWVFGQNGRNFIKTMLNIGKIHETIRVVNDQIGTPTYTYDLARLLVDMVQTDKYGCYHATNEGGYISWYDFACEIFRQAGMNTKVIPVTTAEYGLSKAARPFNSRLEKNKLAENGFEALPHWKDALSRFLAEESERSAEGELLSSEFRGQSQESQ